MVICIICTHTHTNGSRVCAAADDVCETTASVRVRVEVVSAEKLTRD